MKCFEITIEETVAETFTVQAENEKEAIEIARKKYKAAEFILEPGEIGSVQLSIVGSNKWEKL